MPRPLPPLGNLRAFEAVARRLSFTRAADELNVTPGAVSQQVRALEEHLGHPLFVRTKRHVALTQSGSRMLPDVQHALETLTRAVAGEASPADGTALTISVAPSVASKWLMPRLADFSERNPDIDLRITATVALADFKTDKVDVAIRLGSGVYPGLHAELLAPEAIAPYCAPALLKKKPLRRPDDLRAHRLIHDTSMPGENERGAWPRWLEFAGATQVAAHRGTRFSLAELAMQAAIDGTGVVIARTMLAQGDAAAGRLIQPFRLVMPLDVSYFLVMPRANMRRPEVQRFRDWLFGKIGQPPRRRAARA